MKALLCHNFYQQPGGEDQVFADEARLLESRGHQVLRYTLHNDDIDRMGRLGVARRTFWNGGAYAALRTLIARERPDVMHCTNTFPLISPAAYYAARAEGVPVVQSQHNYRFLCPNSLLLRDGRVCEDCVGKWTPWPAVVHGCYRESRAASAVVAGMLTVHRMLRTYRRTVSTYIALAEFSRRKLIEGGLPAERIVVKPNFVDPDPGVGPGQGGYAVYVGRLSAEKGIDVLLAAWSQLKSRTRLKVVGDGPLAETVREAARADQRIEYLGRRTRQEVSDVVGDAACLVMPSICYEHGPKSLIEAYAKGTPVIASRLGAMAEQVVDGVTGLLFAPGDPSDLAATLTNFLSDVSHQERMRHAARDAYQRKYTAERNYRALMAIYERACGGELLHSESSAIAPRTGSSSLLAEQRASSDW
ncbi:MAG: glycosyltransferase [Planctomycetes bacterium]|nr:glycosyltransferase [Planctomycetota bacterium]